MSPRNSMSEYRPGVTSPHTPYLPQRTLFALRFAPLLLAQPPLLLVSLLRPVSTRSLRHSYPPRNIPLNLASLLRFLSACPLHFSLSRSPLLSMSSSSLVTLLSTLSPWLPVCLAFLSSSILPMALPDSRTCIPALLLFLQVFPSVSAISFVSFYLD